MIVEDVGVGLSSPAAICRVHFEQLECYDDLQLGIDVPWRNGYRPAHDVSTRMSGVRRVCSGTEPQIWAHSSPGL